MVGILRILRDYIKEKTDLETVLEPQPVNLQQPHIRITPKGWQFESLKETDNFLGMQYTVVLNCQLKLVGFGDGPDEFLVSVLNASFKLHELFYKPFSIPLIEGNSAGSMTVKANQKIAGEFFQNKQEGVMPYSYEEEFELNIFLPFSVLIT